MSKETKTTRRNEHGKPFQKPKKKETVKVSKTWEQLLVGDKLTAPDGQAYVLLPGFEHSQLWVMVMPLNGQGRRKFSAETIKQFKTPEYEVEVISTPQEPEKAPVSE